MKNIIKDMFPWLRKNELNVIDELVSDWEYIGGAENLLVFQRDYMGCLEHRSVSAQGGHIEVIQDGNLIGCRFGHLCDGKIGWYDGDHPLCCGNCRR